MGWHIDNSGEQPHAVAGRKPNAWGLYDMHGNVMEWCRDWYGRYPAASGGAPAADPNGPAEGKYRLARGGSFAHFPRACRSAARSSYNPAYQLDQLGLRAVMEIDPNSQRR
jgi:formylglycine-generating enzyme required for sulfatase activity